MYKGKTAKIIQTIVIALMYIVLTYISNMFGMANGIFRIRISEALMVLPLFTPAAIPGIFIGSLVSNFITSPFATIGGSFESTMFIKIMYAVLIESGAALVSAFIGYFIGKRQKFAVPVPPIVINALTIPFIYNVWLGLDDHTFLASVGLVCAGEFITCGVLGIALMLGLEDYKDKLFPTSDASALPEEEAVNTGSDKESNTGDGTDV